MDILKNEILPLFEITCVDRESSPSETNSLIQTDINQYSLYVDLKDIYLNRQQSHKIEIADNILTYTIPLHYHEIVLSGKGYYYGDIVINIYSVFNPEFIRVNQHDILAYRKVSLKQYTCDEKKEYILTHIDGETEVKIQMENGQRLYKVEDLGLPRADRTRGALYIWLDPEDSSCGENDSVTREKTEGSSSDIKMLLEILNYHTNSNVVLQ